MLMDEYSSLSLVVTGDGPVTSEQATMNNQSCDGLRVPPTQFLASLRWWGGRKERLR